MNLGDAKKNHTKLYKEIYARKKEQSILIRFLGRKLNLYNYLLQKRADRKTDKIRRRTFFGTLRRDVVSQRDAIMSPSLCASSIKRDILCYPLFKLAKLHLVLRIFTVLLNVDGLNYGNALFAFYTM